MRKLFLLSIAAMPGIFCYGQDTNTNVNQNTTITEQVIERPVYIEKYRTVYVDHPQPARVVKKLPAPLVLHGYLYVYTEDTGNFKNQRDALEVIRNINCQAPFGRNNWRIPTSAELTVLENNAAAVGLGDDIYLATDHANGILRMVSADPSMAEEARLAEAAELEKAQPAESSANTEVVIKGVTWATRNAGSKGTFVSSPEQYGNFYTFEEAQTACPAGWRIPTFGEFNGLAKADSKWTTVNGVKGRNFGSGDNIIFLPAAGFRNHSDGSVDDQDIIGHYWTSDSSGLGSTYGNSGGFHSSNVIPATYYPYAFGFSVRCVRK